MLRGSKEIEKQCLEKTRKNDERRVAGVRGAEGGGGGVIGEKVVGGEVVVWAGGRWRMGGREGGGEWTEDLLQAWTCCRHSVLTSVPIYMKVYICIKLTLRLQENAVQYFKYVQTVFYISCIRIQLFL